MQDRVGGGDRLHDLQHLQAVAERSVQCEERLKSSPGSRRCESLPVVVCGAGGGLREGEEDLEHSSPPHLLAYRDLQSEAEEEMFAPDQAPACSQGSGELC